MAYPLFRTISAAALLLTGCCPSPRVRHCEDQLHSTPQWFVENSFIPQNPNMATFLIQPMNFTKTLEDGTIWRAYTAVTTNLPANTTFVFIQETRPDDVNATTLFTDKRGVLCQMYDGHLKEPGQWYLYLKDAPGHETKFYLISTDLTTQLFTFYYRPSQDHSLLFIQ